MRPRAYIRSLLIAFIAPVLLSACGRTSTTPELQAILAAESAPQGVPGSVWTEAKAFYAAREATLAWVRDDGPTDDTVAALDTLRAVDSHGLDPDDYGEPELRSALTTLQEQETSQNKDERARQIAALDVRLTGALLNAARHVATGRLQPRSIDARWNATRAAPDYVAALTQAAGDEIETLFDRVQPVHPEYASLRMSLVALRGQARNVWPRVSKGAAAPLRQRLAASGYLETTSATDSGADETLVAGVKRFQEHHGLPATGVLDALTLERLNVPLETRLAQVAMNLERWRWLPDDLGARHFLVNVPRFHLEAREDGKPVLEMRVVVGKRGNETPLFADEMETVVFSPYWNIPETIALEETAPAAARDPEYLSRNNMEILNSSGDVVSADMIPWDDEGALEGYRFRQRPGASNALGYVKFLFPNEHAVYLHDTPADALFQRIGRAFSHGCVRVEEPERLAEYVLRDQSEWTSDVIRTSMRSGTERHIRVSESIPIFIVYMTAWVDQNGGLHFQDDVYGYDARQARAGQELRTKN